MGIYDREYYRREGPSFLGSLADRGRGTTGLIIVNVVCFIIQMMSRSVNGEARHIDEWFTQAFSLNVDLVLQGQVWRLLTYAFLHDTGSFWHLLMNMLFLFWFGRQVEEVIGPREYLRYY